MLFSRNKLTLLVPAVYYAHLASNRAACHDPSPSSEGPKGGQKFDEMRGQMSRTGSSGRDKTTDAPPLLPLGDTSTPGNFAAAVKIRTTMWYI
jgi:eukaryotic translation initiation factor 2C